MPIDDARSRRTAADSICTFQLGKVEAGVQKFSLDLFSPTFQPGCRSMKHETDEELQIPYMVSNAVRNYPRGVVSVFI